MLFLLYFVLHFVPNECILDTLFTGDTLEVFGQVVPDAIPSQYRWLDRYQTRSELRLSFRKQSITFLLHESPDQSRVRLESLFTVRGFSKPQEPSFPEQSDFSLRSGHLMGNKSVRMTGFVLDGIFSGFVDGSADGVEVSVRAKFATFLDNGQPYILTRKKLGLFDHFESSSFCNYQRAASNDSRNATDAGRSFEFLSQRTTTKSFCRLRYSVDPKATKLWLVHFTSSGPISYRIRQMVGMILAVVFTVNQKLLMLPMCKMSSSVCHNIQLYIGHKDVNIFAPDFCLGKVSPNDRLVYCFNASVMKEKSHAGEYLWSLFATHFPCDFYHCTSTLVTANNFGVTLGLASSNSFYKQYQRAYKPNLVVNIKRNQANNFLSPIEAAIVNTHEIGHQLGADHDDGKCGTTYIMASKFSRLSNLFDLGWSKCSIKQIHEEYSFANNFNLSRFPSHVPCLTNAITTQSCLSPHPKCCFRKSCIVKYFYQCSPTGALNAECCTENCKWANSRKCWGSGDRQCMKPGLCARDKCTASPVRNGKRCDGGVCLHGKCSSQGVCAFLKSGKCSLPVNTLTISSSSCYHNCYKRSQHCERAVLLDGKPIPLSLGARCNLNDDRFGICSLSIQCLLNDTKKIDWRRGLGGSIPLFFHPLFFDETGKSLVRLWPIVLLLWIVQMVFASYSYVIFAHSDRVDVMGEIYNELIKAKWIWT